MLYAGYEFRTERSQVNVKFDNAKVRVPMYAHGDGVRGTLLQFFGSIHRMFIHEAWEGGPEMCVLEIDWYTNVGRAEVSGNPLVEPLPAVRTIKASRYMRVCSWLFAYTSQPFFLPYRLCPIGNCYQIPVAIWPHDPLGLLPADDPHRNYLEVMDRNQDETVEAA